MSVVWQRRVLAVALAVLVSNMLFALAGAPPGPLWLRVVQGSLGNGYGLGETLARATPLLCTGASVAVALRAGLFNIGAEGQLAAGILFAALAGAHLPVATPGIVAVPICAAAAATAGASLGAFTGWLRARFGTHEVIASLMLNGLVAVLTTYLYGGPLRVGEQIHTAPIVAGARLPPLSGLFHAMTGSSANGALLVAIAAWVGVQAWLGGTYGGARVRAVGASPDAARALGVPVQGTWIRTLAIAGALAGLGAVHHVLGARGYAESGLGAGQGFDGLAVAMLAPRSTLGLVVAAAGLAALSQGALVVNAIVPASLLGVIRAVVLLAAAAVAMRRVSAGTRDGGRS